MHQMLVRRANEPSLRHAAAAGFATLLLGIGISRFAYPPLIPALVAHGWFGVPAAAYLGATNLAGYLLGAATARRFGRFGNARIVVRGAMLAATLSLLACAAPLGFAWFFAWRLLAGIAGGVLMVVGAQSVLVFAPARLRGRIGGIVFTGVGIGIAVAGSLVPWLVHFGLTVTWLSFAGAGACLTAITWTGIPATEVKPPASGGHMRSPHLVWPILSYAFCGLGFVPHTVFWVDFIARSLNRGIATGGAMWALLGAAGIAGPLMGGLAAERIGFAHSFRLAALLHAGAVALPLVSTAPAALAISSLGVGALAIGVTSLAAGRAAELAARLGQPVLWGQMTIAYAVTYAGGGYLLSFLLVRTHSYDVVFGIGAAALLLAGTIGLNTKQATPPDVSQRQR